MTNANVPQPSNQLSTLKLSSAMFIYSLEPDTGANFFKEYSAIAENIEAIFQMQSETPVFSKPAAIIYQRLRPAFVGRHSDDSVYQVSVNPSQHMQWMRDTIIWLDDQAEELGNDKEELEDEKSELQYEIENLKKELSAGSDLAKSLHEKVSVFRRKPDDVLDELFHDLKLCGVSA